MATYGDLSKFTYGELKNFTYDQLNRLTSEELTALLENKIQKLPDKYANIKKLLYDIGISLISAGIIKALPKLFELIESLPK